MFVALGTQHAMRMRHIIICGLSGSTVFFHIKVSRLLKNFLQQKIYFDFLYNFVWNISHYKKKWARMIIKVHRSYC